ncbi:type IV pilus assembly protein PilX (plasmid) [Legionella adelaidensis]|uniref:Tfp pilus assembly protein PilX n=1 Tax=Legionella adelaidensis TaxID=45056 RepID=A0A0W0R361_9GAMM|nr:PilX N-terminal domain-containing pilus assembly protein [Legionella adelaidensis]KTC65512.1 Tfp pilus assembly protein PilX [Legionella adelaidensis]VEH84667.1 type IV pilus assembly protein PilX [Legionella adelaidensis]
MIKQCGATLAVTLIMLFLITLLGVSTMQVTSMQEKMASTLQDKELSFNAAETALAAGESWLMSLSILPPAVSTCNPFPCVQAPYQNLVVTAQTNTWWETNSAVYNTSLTNITTQPRYYIEALQFVPDSPVIGDSSVKSKGVTYYQVTARGTGSTTSSVTILQTSLGRRF